MRAVPYVCLVVCLYSVPLVLGQTPATKTVMSEFRGRILDAGNASYIGLVVEVTNLQDRTIHDRADVSTDGTFWFRAIPEGDYQVRVLSLYGDEVASTVTGVGMFSMPF